ncbi:CPBP family intramembrane metalloprotease [Bacillus mangrovi]|uniref:CPBP family intramembrane metalloprotease n=1 Tax=Metabacillus mangrovi TaxID=1491830 RepID=A0A7X2S2X4_9BACI|nr:CPBP family intramembrane metalloprotease [Metabacillus mangrovi]
MIHAMTDREMVSQLYITQAVLAVLGLLGSFFFLGGWLVPAEMMNPSWASVIIGICAAAVVILADRAVEKIAPDGLYDDGGINEKLFRSCTIPHIAAMTAMISIVEEWLFRGVLQSEFGLAASAIIFSVLHIRYLSKLLLFIMVTAISLFIGILFEYTGSLLAAVTAHFIIDLFFGIQIRLKYVSRGESKSP